MPARVWPGFDDAAVTGRGLAAWRDYGPEAALSLLAQLAPQQLQASAPLVQELSWRLQGHAGPRFGLPVLEALAAGTVVLLADSRG